MYKRFGTKFCSVWMLFSLLCLTLVGCTSKASPPGKVELEKPEKQPVKMKRTLTQLDTVEDAIKLVNQNVTHCIALQWTGDVLYGNVYFQAEDGGRKKYSLPIEERFQSLKESLTIIPSTLDPDSKPVEPRVRPIDSVSDDQDYEYAGTLIFVVYKSDEDSALRDCKVFAELSVAKTGTRMYSRATTVVWSGKVKISGTFGWGKNGDRCEYYLLSKSDERTPLLEVNLGADKFSENALIAK